MIFFATIMESVNETVNSTIDKIKNGDIKLKEKFIEDYIPFIIKIISSFYSTKIVDVRNSDEYSIGLMAFNEAIDKFDASKNTKFLNFARMVIRRRMVDYFRKISSKSKHEIPFSYFDSKNESELEEKLNVFDFSTETTRYDLIQELNSFSKELEAFGLSIKNLPDYMPKHKDSKQMCLSIAKNIIDNKEVYNKLMTKKYFPMKEISKIIDVHPKTVERNREFIICICIIHKNDYENFKGYLKQIY